MNKANMINENFHPRLAGFTAGREFHPAPKVSQALFIANIISQVNMLVRNYINFSLSTGVARYQVIHQF
jgi:hypothetical protein